MLAGTHAFDIRPSFPVGHLFSPTLFWCYLYLYLLDGISLKFKLCTSSLFRSVVLFLLRNIPNQHGLSIHLVCYLLQFLGSAMRKSWVLFPRHCRSSFTRTGYGNKIKQGRKRGKRPLPCCQLTSLACLVIDACMHA